jgi:hypothetical protein
VILRPQLVQQVSNIAPIVLKEHGKTANPFPVRTSRARAQCGAPH